MTSAQRVHERLWVLFVGATITFEAPVFTVTVDGVPVVAVNVTARTFTLPGRFWPKAKYEGRGWPEALADAAFVAIQATNRASRPRPTVAHDAKRERTVERVKKMLALAMGQAGTPEGETAARIALRVMSEHALFDRDLVEPASVKQRSYRATAPWDRSLWATCARHVGAVALEDTLTGKLVVFGPDETLDLAAYLHHTIARGLVAERADDGSIYANGFLSTAVSAVAQRLTAMRKGAQRLDPVGTSLVVAQAASTAAWVSVHVDVEPTAPRRSRRPPLGAALFVPEGAAAGKRVPIVTGIREKP